MRATHAITILVSVPIAFATVAIPAQGSTLQPSFSVVNVPTESKISENVSNWVSTKKKETAAQRNAKKKAQSYLRFMAFSRKELINQLKFDGFAAKDATYGVDVLKVDWKKQAVKKAKSYLSFMAFSKSELKGQLIFDGFTNAQAQYGVDKAYK